MTPGACHLRPRRRPSGLRIGHPHLVFAVALTLGLARGLGAQSPGLGGLGEYQAIGYFSTRGGLDRVGRNQVILQPELDLELGQRASIFAAVEARADQARPERSRLYMREGYLELFLGDFDVRVGRTILRWGRADGLNPTDHFGSRDFTDLLDRDERVGQDALSVRWYAGLWSLEWVVVPRLRASWLPDEDGRWWPETPDSVVLAGGPGEDPVWLSASSGYGPASWPETGLERAAWGLRASTTMAGWDLSLSWYDGPSHLPAYAIRLDPDPSAGTARVLLERPYYRLWSVGADFSTVLGGVGLHGEAAWIDPEDDPRLSEGGRQPWVHWVVGGDRRFRGVMGDRDLVLVAEWSRELWPTAGYRPEPLDLAHAFRNALLVRAELSTDAFSSVELEGIRDVAESGWFLRFARSWSPWDGLQLRVALDLPGGDPGSLLGSYDGNRRLHLTVRYER